MLFYRRNGRASGETAYMLRNKCLPPRGNVPDGGATSSGINAEIREQPRRSQSDEDTDRQSPSSCMSRRLRPSKSLSDVCEEELLSANDRSQELRVTARLNQHQNSR